MGFKGATGPLGPPVDFRVAAKSFVAYAPPSFDVLALKLAL